jgi:selenide,water dikinase
MGGTPIMALAIVGMPINVLPREVIADILRGGQDVCTQAGIPVAGGHTIDSVEPIYGLAAMGLVHPARVKRNADARAGDALILSKPLGVGILSAALKKNRLDEAGYQAMIASTTRLNTPGPALASLDGVHAITDVTGFGLLGHALEMSRGAGLRARIDLPALPWLPGVRDMAKAGMITGASARNWASYGDAIALGDGVDDVSRALLTDPQTSGGLLVACDRGSVPQVLQVMAAQGFTQAAVVGEIVPGEPGVEIAVG